MPEMIEVEYYRRLAESNALEREISGVRVVDSRYLRGGTTTVRGLSSALVGSRFATARRHGKLLVLETDGDRPSLGLRFGMTGDLVVDGKVAIDRLEFGPVLHRPAWVRFRIRFVDGGRLEIHDPRRLGSVALDPDESAMGPDAATVTLAEFRTAMAARSLNGGPPVKARLQDQSRLAGVGNLLSDEILWRAALDPHRRTSTLTPTEMRRLHRHVTGTIADLTERGGSHTGDLMPERRVSGRCPRDGAELQHATVGGRTAWWCPKHQH
jgi:formamidopyrimidine-DNA glycosylase